MAAWKITKADIIRLIDDIGREYLEAGTNTLIAPRSKSKAELQQIAENFLLIQKLLIRQRVIEARYAPKYGELAWRRLKQMGIGGASMPDEIEADMRDYWTIAQEASRIWRSPWAQPQEIRAGTPDPAPGAEREIPDIMAAALTRPNPF